MITLSDDQVLFSEPEWAVKTGGSYNPTDLVGVYKVGDPTKTVLVAHQANYISTGTIA